MRLAVVGHVEWVRFARVDRVPLAGDIIGTDRTWEEPAGGGGVTVVRFAAHAGDATLFTALGDDDAGHRARDELEALGVRVHASFRPEPQRLAFTFLDSSGERTITTIGPRLNPSADDPLPWEELEGADGVYFTAGDAGALRAARRARVLVSTSRVGGFLQRAGVALDAVVGSARDPSEAHVPIDPPPRLVVTTEGRSGGRYETADGRTGRYGSAPVPGPVKDAYGAGDSFAAGLTAGLAEGRAPEDALGLAARFGAEALTRAGAHGGPGAAGR